MVKLLPCCHTATHYFVATQCIDSKTQRRLRKSVCHYDSVLINRLQIGHTRLTNSYLLKGENQPECEACHSPLTVKYFLVDCTRHSAARWRYFGVATLKDVFENVASRNIIAYVKDISFYNRNYKLWSTYFGIFEKVWDGSTRPQNFVKQSSKTKQSYYQNQILNFGQDLCYVMHQKP